MVTVTISAKQLEQFGKRINFAISEQIAQGVRREIEKMNLIDTSEFWQSIQIYPDGSGVFSDDPKAVFLEYGTMEYWQQYGLNTYTDPVHPKKKDMSNSEKKTYPKGMQPFAPFRRVVYNPNKMSAIVARAIKAI